MAMSRYTGNTTMSACELCGTMTKHAEVELGFKNPTIRWLASPHDAPCGAHCDRSPGPTGLAMCWGTR
jgi:hypothetical protein